MSMRSAVGLGAVLALATSVLGAGCGSGSAPPTTGAIAVVATLAAGQSGNLGDARVAIYASSADWQSDTYLTKESATTSGSGAVATATFANLAPATYYVDVWKDVNANLSFDTGDLYGAYGTCTPPASLTCALTAAVVVAGQTQDVAVTVYALP